jgi:hypothetical protein
LIHCDNDGVGRINNFYVRRFFQFSFLHPICRLTPRIYYSRWLNLLVAPTFVYVLYWLFYFWDYNVFFSIMLYMLRTGIGGLKESLPGYK